MYVMVLKPVHRRILYGLNEQGMTPDKPYKNQHVLLGTLWGNIIHTATLQFMMLW